MKIIKVSTELEMSVHEFPSGTIREHNKALCELIGNGCDLVEHVMPKDDSKASEKPEKKDAASKQRKTEKTSTKSSELSGQMSLFDLL